MKYVKWIEVTLKLGIRYIIQKVVNSEQIQFYQKERGEAEERPLSQAHALICPEGSPPNAGVIWSRIHPRIHTNC